MTRRLLPLLALALAACGDAGTKGNPPPPAVSAPPPPSDAVGEAARSYRIGGSISPSPLARGSSGTLTLEIALTRPDVHVQQEFPLKVTLQPSAGLAPDRMTLGHAQAKDPAAKGRRWEVGVRAVAPGRQQILADVRFAICKESEPAWCVTRNERVTAEVEVR
jgi:hypothetical protein